MKRLSAILVALVLAATTAVTAFAAGINSNEQAVLDELKTSVTMSGGEMIIPTEFVNQVENHFNTIDLTAEEKDDILAIIKEGKTFLANSGAANIKDLTLAQKQELLEYGEKVVGAIGMTMTYDKTTGKLSIYDPDGNVVFSAVPYLTTDGQVAENPIKTTGAESNNFGFIALGATAILLVAGGSVYLVKSKKERA